MIHFSTSLPTESSFNASPRAKFANNGFHHNLRAQNVASPTSQNSNTEEEKKAAAAARANYLNKAGARPSKRQLDFSDSNARFPSVSSTMGAGLGTKLIATGRRRTSSTSSGYCGSFGSTSNATSNSISIGIANVNKNRSAYHANGRPGSVDIDSFYEDDSEDLMTRATIEGRKLLSHKNSHKSRTRFGRGLAKKNGAGGHFTWGIAGSEIDEHKLAAGIIDPIVDNSDPVDPNYDSDSDENCIFETIMPPLDSDEVEKYLTPIFQEYFEHGDTAEVGSILNEVNLTSNYHQILSTAISVAMERKSSHRELASILISDLFGKLMTSADIEKGFDLLLSQLDDLILDTPDACIVLGNFIARAVADDCMPPRYVTATKEQLESKLLLSTPPPTTIINGTLSPTQDKTINNNNISTVNQNTNNTSAVDVVNVNVNGTRNLSKAEALALKAIEHAYTLINAKRGLIRLDTVWGLTGGARPVKYLVKQMRLLLKEYLVSLDINEAERCLRELEVPHFFHEFVYEAILMAIEDVKKPDDLNAVAKLLKSLTDINLISVDQLRKGFVRLFGELPEIQIDVPHAYNTLEKFMQSCFKEKLFLPRGIVDQVPSRGRKRFISENNDGGRIK